MKKFGHLLLLFLFGALLYNGAYAQEEEDKYHNIPPRLHDQKDQYDEGSYAFPPQPRSNWGIGLQIGPSWVSGDVSPQLGYGGALYLRKAFGHTFSVRAQLAGGLAYGLQYRSNRGYIGHGNNPWNEYYGNGPYVFYNFRNNWYDATIQGVVNLNNINFYKEQNKWNIYVFGGIGLQAYRTKVDALNANGDGYDFTTIPAFNTLDNGGFNFFSAKSEVTSALKDLMDGDYESVAEYHRDGSSITIGTDDNCSNCGTENNRIYTVNPTLNGGLGLSFRVSRRVGIFLEHRLSWTNDDLLDGQRWQEWGGTGETVLTRDFDSYQFTTIGLELRLGKGEESLWWNNPLGEVYRNVSDTKKLIQSLQNDADGDGVADIFDQEPDTPEGFVVDTKGRTLDSDGDGYPDNEDDQPFTPKGCDVDNRGVALDGDGDNVPDCFDKERNSAAGALVDASGRTIKCDCPEPVVEGTCMLPSIRFDLDKDVIKRDAYGDLFYVARYMMDNPTKRVRAIGHTDVRNSDQYNMDLSNRRVTNAVDFIVNNFGIDRARFETDYKGETMNAVAGLPADHKNPKLEPLHYLNRRVDFECIR
jgi:outer membrane protein OmpA-like peptidoglycan-associated protein